LVRWWAGAALPGAAASGERCRRQPNFKAQICARQQKPMLTKPNVTETMLDDFQSFFLCASICVVDVGRPNLDHEASVGAANVPAAEVQ
jgi:hypothetical protein